MRPKLLIATAIVVTALVTGNGKAAAQENVISVLMGEKTSQPHEKKTHKQIHKKKHAPKPEIYVVKKGDTLEKLSKARRTTWKRVWDKNPSIPHPDLLKPGQKLTIPKKDEKLKNRPVPPLVTGVSKVSLTRTPVAGNLYEPGQCTWYVKNRRPDLPNNLGDASNWLYNAQSQGMATGSIPRAGAVGWRTGHVVYIESVNPDGTVNYSDMNGGWVPFEIGHGTVPAGSLIYIY